MTIPTTYATLQTAAAEWAHRTGDSTYTDYLPTAVAMCEAIMSSRIKSRAMEVRSNLSTVAGTAYVTLPTDLMEVRRLYLTSPDPTRMLSYVTPDELTHKYPAATSTGEPEVFTVVGTQLQLAPTPDAVYTVELTYLQKIPALSAGVNWVITNYPNVYLFGTLAHMAMFTGDTARAQQWQAMFDAGIKSINDIDWYSGSTMAVRPA